MDVSHQSEPLETCSILAEDENWRVAMLESDQIEAHLATKIPPLEWEAGR
jgi:hypothetical protein